MLKHKHSWRATAYASGFLSLIERGGILLRVYYEVMTNLSVLLRASRYSIGLLQAIMEELSRDKYVLSVGLISDGSAPL